MNAFLSSLPVLWIVAQDLVIAAADSDEGGSALLLLAGPLAAGGVYWLLYRYYRNVDKSHDFERETLIESQPVTGTDVKIKELRRTERRQISGNNRDQHRSRVRRLP